jgi:hypothetical protein
MFFGHRSTQAESFDLPVREDGAISVRRGFCVREWREMAQQAELAGAKVWLFFGTCVVLEARKED